MAMCVPFHATMLFADKTGVPGMFEKEPPMYSFESYSTSAVACCPKPLEETPWKTGDHTLPSHVASRAAGVPSVSEVKVPPM